MTRSKSRGGRRQSVAPRGVVLGLDRLEWGISLFGSGIALVLALVTAIEWARNLPTITTVKYISGKACPTSHPKHVGEFCEHILRTTRSEWEVKFFFILIVALCLLFFTLRRKRAGVACFAVFLGLGLGLGSGVVFLFLGVWLIIRAYRLQKYGVAGMLSSNRVAKEVGDAKRQGRSPNITSASEEALIKPVTPPSASKRYTPKKPPRKRR
ncbi:MAG: hypothetical protein JWM55_1432 [Acidimicrobiaceae bacterium]|nr:hypothetical protein [Acidimicrobiaceae bacterium]